MELEKLLMDLSNAFGPSGYEKEARAVFEAAVAGCAEITHDRLGSALAWHYGSAKEPRIMLAAHLDEVGLMVRGILPSGYLKVVPLGSWWAPTLMAQQFVIRSQKGDYIGVVGAKPPHFLGEDEKNRPLRMGDLYLDLGAQNSAEVTALGIVPGDTMVPFVKATRLGPEGTLVGKGFDDRAGCAVIARVLQELDPNHPNLVVGVGTVQEENGIKGARTAAAAVKPDLCIVLEGAPADDFPDAGSIVQGRLGGGPQIRVLDPTMIANRALTELAIKTAVEMGIPYQVAIRESGGTDAKEIQLYGTGVPTLVISVPVRYAHSHHSIIRLSDVEATVTLLNALMTKLDASRVNELQERPW